MTEGKDAAETDAAPQSEADWTVHSLNIHGDFFERWCGQAIGETRSWSLTTTNYPVAVEGHESALDIRADAQIGNKKLVLLVECKKNNPEFVNWVFFRKDASRNGNHTPVILPHVVENGNGRLQDTSFGTIPITMTDGARETRGTYLAYSKQKSDKTKTSNSAITDAAKQIALATQFVWGEEMRRMEEHIHAKLPPSRTILMPVILTSARIFLCDFNAQDVSPETGEIPYAAATLSEERVVVYEYPLPRHLHARPPQGVVGGGPGDRWVRRHIFVVHSAIWMNFLKGHALQPAMVEQSG